jgi:ATP-binding cassette subfamily B protein
MSNVLSQLQDIITIITLVAGLTIFEPWLILLLVIAIIPSFINEIRFSRSSYSLARSWTPERRELDYLRFIGASDVTAKEVKLFGLADFLSKRFSKLAHRYYEVNKRLAIRRSVWGSVFHLIGDLSYYGAYVLIIFRTVAGSLTLGDLTFLAGSFARLRNQLQTIFSRFSQITESALYLKDYFDFMDMESKVLPQSEIAPIPKVIERGFRFENVSFRYPGMEELVLDDISFTLRPGEKLALVGENGAGKTTLIKLLLRLYEPTEGIIHLDDIDIRNFDKLKYQELFGAIFQDFVRYYFTARENIGVGMVDAMEDTDRVVGAAERSLADEVIAALPKQYEQILGRRFAEGKELSGGQWQKIALARAYMKDAKVIILDEPTSSLDAKAEYAAFERFIDLTKEKTAVIISHRFSTVRLADRILVLKNGKILEQGSHEALLEENGLYAELFRLQAKGYR